MPLFPQTKAEFSHVLFHKGKILLWRVLWISVSHTHCDRSLSSTKFDCCPCCLQCILHFLIWLNFHFSNALKFFKDRQGKKDKHLLLLWYIIVLHEMKPSYPQRPLHFTFQGTGSKYSKRDIFLFDYICTVPWDSSERLVTNHIWDRMSTLHQSSAASVKCLPLKWQ